MKQIAKIFLGLWAFTAVACNQFLDIVPDDIATIENAFTMRINAKKYLFTCYSYMPQHGITGSNPALCGGDEFTHSTNFRSAAHVHAWYIANGYQNAADPRCDFWRGSNGGNDLYEAINHCNIFLENIHKVPDMGQAEIIRWQAEVKFLKAYYHYYLVRLYGPVPIKDSNLPIDATVDEVKVYRNTLDECFQYIVNLLDEALAQGLPETITSEADELGRITQGIAMAVKAEVLMTAASPLFNGNTDYAGLTDNRGIEIFCPNKSEAEKQARWEAAAQACRAAIDYLEAAGHGLYTYDLQEYTMSEVTRGKMHLRGAVTEPWNKEIIWADPNSREGELQANAFPRGLDPTKSTNAATKGNLSVPLKIAAQFYSQNGVPIEDDITYDYENRFQLQKAVANDQYYIKNGYTTVRFNFGREPRYYAALGFDGSVWFGQGTVNEASPLYIQSKANQGAANVGETTQNLTGFWPKKLVHFKTTATASAITYHYYPFPVMRMAGLYLFYAEALNELGTSTEEVLPWIDRVRQRAGLLGVAESWTRFTHNPDLFRSQEGLRSIIHRERLIELAFEGQRFWDLRRWKEAYSQLNQPITGWTLEESTEANYYKERLLFSQTFGIRDYFWPIADDEIYADNNIVQNFGW